VDDVVNHVIFVIARRCKRRGNPCTAWIASSVFDLLAMTVLVFFVFVMNPAFACDVIDDAGNHIHLSQPAKRIISLAPDITESLFALGAGNHIVGVMSGSDYPPAATSIQTIGSYAGLDLERIIALQPDLIITWDNNFPRQLAVLKKLHIPVYQNDPKQLNDVAHAIRNFGCLTGDQQQADKVATIYLNKLSLLRKHVQSKKNVRVFYQISGDSLLTVNRHSWINQAIEICGGRNVFADAKLTAIEVDLEAVIAANPEVIVAADTNDRWQKRWLRYGNMVAVKQKQFVTIPPDLIDRPGPRLVEGVRLLCSYQ
jgi:iron complex transport system substrate-binding protein